MAANLEEARSLLNIPGFMPTRYEWERAQRLLRDLIEELENSRRPMGDHCNGCDYWRSGKRDNGGQCANRRCRTPGDPGETLAASEEPASVVSL